jgi:hypothetical protein
LLESLLGMNGLADVRAAVIDTFDRRAKQAWPPIPVVTAVIGSAATVKAAAEYVMGLIKRVDAARP